MEELLLELKIGAKVEAEALEASLGNENGFAFIPGEKERGKSLDFPQSFSG